MSNHDLITDTPLASTPALALTAFGLGLLATGGITVVGWVRLAVHGTIHPGHYGSTRRAPHPVRTTPTKFARIREERP